MKLALGLIETRGLVAAIEAADAMAKASNITIVGKEKSTAALITIKIVGEVAAVKSAIDAGAYAAQKIGELISTHIIPRPSEEIVSLIYSSQKVISNSKKDNVKKKGKKKKKVTEQSFFDEVSVEENNKPNISFVSDSKESEETNSHNPVLDVNQDSFKEEFADVEIDVSSEESIGDNFIEESKEQNSQGDSESVDEKDEIENDSISEDEKSSYKMENLEILNVHQLRKKARAFPNFPIKGREISKANRGILLDYFKSLL